MLAIATWDFVEALADSPDQGLWRPRRGRRPGMFSPSAPEALCDIIFSYGWSFRRVAEVLAVSQRTVQRWWAGEAVPRAHRAARLQDVANDLRRRDHAVRRQAGNSADPALDLLRCDSGALEGRSALAGVVPGQGPLRSIALDPFWHGLVSKDLARRSPDMECAARTRE